MLTVMLALILVFVSGCSWSPGRDNQYDPASPYYTPPVVHHPPVLDSLKVITDCVDDRLAYRCAFEARCYITDVDNNLVLDSVMAMLDTFHLGPMAYDPLGRSFYIRRSQSDFPQDDLSSFQFRPLQVTIVNQFGARDTLVELFPAVQLAWPVPDHPVGDASIPDTVFQYTPAVGWWAWGPFDGRHTYSLAVYWNESTLVWDTSGIPASDTTAVIGDSLKASWVIRNPYKWYLTVVDEVGNRMTAEPQYFLVYPGGAPLLHATKPKVDKVN